MLQHDNLVPTMTCDESLQFYAAIILPPGTSKEVRAQRIRDTLKLVGLQDRQYGLVSSE